MARNGSHANMENIYMCETCGNFVHKTRAFKIVAPPSRSMFQIDAVSALSPDDEIVMASISSLIGSAF